MFRNLLWLLLKPSQLLSDAKKQRGMAQHTGLEGQNLRMSGKTVKPYEVKEKRSTQSLQQMAAMLRRLVRD